MRSFRHSSPPLRLYQGINSLDMLGRELDRLESRRAVIFCGSTLGRPGSPLELVLAAVGARCAGVYSGVRAHSPLPSVEEAAEELRRLDADAVVAVGGGSTVVTARAASILLAETGDPRTLCTSQGDGRELRSPKLLAPKLPQLVVPTSPTTATVKAGSAMIDPATGRRLVLFDPKTRAHSVFLHPTLVSSTPLRVVISAGLNTLAMAVEGLLSRKGDPISDALLMHAVRLLERQLTALAQGDDLETRADLMTASILCGRGTDHTGAGLTIPLGHAISSRLLVDNGIASAILLPHVVRFNSKAARTGMRKVAEVLVGGQTQINPVMLQDAVCLSLDRLFSELNVPRRLRDVGVTRESLMDLAAASMEDWFVRDNPRPIQGEAALLQVLEAAW
jgi:alcohol dehydrogenase